MSDKKELEATLKTFLKDELMLSQIEFMGNKDDLSLDSLAQTELRIFLEEEFDLDISMEAMPVSVTQTLENLINHVDQQIKVTA
ncbi:hypothetical protein [Litoribacillus peritrichatus]|uniref:Carrier domain-containing protein n=1 Tax=Litoribacillus peritrichatus TaxID=718191 RepID=A0ABP7MCY9_9GAMM